MEIVDVYAIHSATVVEIKVREGSLVKQTQAANKSVNSIKLVVQEAIKNKNTWEENPHRIDNAVALAYTNFLEEGIIKEMVPEAKID